MCGPYHELRVEHSHYCNCYCYYNTLGIGIGIAIAIAIAIIVLDKRYIRPPIRKIYQSI